MRAALADKDVVAALVNPGIGPVRGACDGKVGYGVPWCLHVDVGP